MIDISVVIPVYNALGDGGAMLEECVMGAASHPCDSREPVSLELILVDDGSTDGSGEVCDRYEASLDGFCQVRVIHQANRGLGGARNAGVKAARGRYVFFLDADDRILPDSLHMLLKAADTCDADIVCGTWTEADQPVRDVSPDSAPRMYGPRRFLRDTLYQTGGHPSAWAMIVKRPLAARVPFAEHLWYEDLDWLPRLYLAAGSIVQTGICCYYYRQHCGSFIHTWSPARLDVLKVTEGVERYVSAHAPELLPAAADRRLSANFNIFGLACKHGDNAVADRCWQIIRRYRAASLFGRHVRLKNRAGAFLSYLGRPLLARVLTRYYS